MSSYQLGWFYLCVERARQKSTPTLNPLWQRPARRASQSWDCEDDGGVCGGGLYGVVVDGWCWSLVSARCRWEAEQPGVCFLDRPAGSHPEFLLKGGARTVVDPHRLGDIALDGENVH